MVSGRVPVRALNPYEEMCSTMNVAAYLEVEGPLGQGQVHDAVRKVQLNHPYLR